MLRKKCLSALVFVCPFILLIVSLYVHELGHYSVAKLLGWDVSNFVIGDGGLDFNFSGTDFRIGLPFTSSKLKSMSAYIMLRNVVTADDIKGLTMRKKLSLVVVYLSDFVFQLLFLFACFFKILYKQKKLTAIVVFTCLMFAGTDILGTLNIINLL